MPMVTGRAIRCGVPARPSEPRASRRFSGQWPGKFFPEQGTKQRGATLTVTPRFFFVEKIWPGLRLFANDGNFGGRDFQAHEPAIRVEEEQHFEVAGGYAHPFVSIAVAAGPTSGYYADGSRREALGDEHR